jgi:hypothetical protein
MCVGVKRAYIGARMKKPRRVKEMNRCRNCPYWDHHCLYPGEYGCWLDESGGTELKFKYPKDL